MKFETCHDIATFCQSVLEILLRHEEQNNLPISFIKNEQGLDSSGWLMGVVRDDAGSVILTAACTPPYNIVLYETDNRPRQEAVNLLAVELKARGWRFPGVLAEQSLARRFAEAFAGGGNFRKNLSMVAMRLEQPVDIIMSPGVLRPLREEDLFFAPYWGWAFEEECHVGLQRLSQQTEQLQKRLGHDFHFIWEDGIPVSQAVHARSTEHGAVVSGVYTPPHYRSRGYASSAVSALSRLLLERGNRFCCLFADAENPVSCGIYRKIGYVEQCILEDIIFTP